METMDATYPNYEAAIKASTVGAGKMDSRVPTTII